MRSMKTVNLFTWKQFNSLWDADRINYPLIIANSFVLLESNLQLKLEIKHQQGTWLVEE